MDEVVFDYLFGREMRQVIGGAHDYCVVYDSCSAIIVCGPLQIGYGYDVFGGEVHLNYGCLFVMV